MAEYIEREALLAEIAAMTIRPDDLYEYGIMAGVDEVKKKVAVIHAADVAPVVRCKDCKYWQDNNGGYPHNDCRWGKGETPDADDFCSYGERKDGDC